MREGRTTIVHTLALMVPFLVGTGFLELASRAGWVESYLLPAPSAVVGTL